MIKIHSILLFLFLFNVQNTFCMQTQAREHRQRKQEHEYWQIELKRRQESKLWWDGYFKELMETAKEERRKALEQKNNKQK